MEAAVLKGTQNGYELIFDDRAAMEDVFSTLEKLLDSLKTQTITSNKQISFDIMAGNRIITANDRQRLETVFANYDTFSIHKIVSDAITKEKAKSIKEQENVHVMARTIRNGQDVTVEGDVLFLGQIHQGGKLLVSGNIFVMGNVEGIIQAGFPNVEKKFIIGDVRSAQQVRIGEQFAVMDDDMRAKINSRTIMYINDLHTLEFGELNELKQISPKFFNQIGGITNG